VLSSSHPAPTRCTPGDLRELAFQMTDQPIEGEASQGPMLTEAARAPQFASVGSTWVFGQGHLASPREQVCTMIRLSALSMVVAERGMHVSSWNHSWEEKNLAGAPPRRKVLPPGLHGEQQGSLGVLRHTKFEPPSPVAKPHASSRRGTTIAQRASGPRDSALRLMLGPRQHLSRTEGVILGPGEAGGDRCCFTRNSELF
jgi:hypothetical protein